MTSQDEYLAAVACKIASAYAIAKLNDKRAFGVQSVQGGSHSYQTLEVTDKGCYGMPLEAWTEPATLAAWTV